MREGILGHLKLCGRIHEKKQCSIELDEWWKIDATWRNSWDKFRLDHGLNTIYKDEGMRTSLYFSERKIFQLLRFKKRTSFFLNLRKSVNIYGIIVVFASRYPQSKNFKNFENFYGYSPNPKIMQRIPFKYNAFSAKNALLSHYI